MRKRFLVACTVLGGFRGPKVRDDMVPTWEADESGVYRQVIRAQPCYEYQTKAFGEEVTAEEFAHKGPEEFDRLLDIGAIREELTDEPEPTPMATKPQPPPAKRRMGELMEQLPASVR